MFRVALCGFDSYHAKPLDSIQPQSIDYTLLVLKTDAFFEIDGEYINTKPESVVLFEKYSYIHYGRRKPRFNDDWVHFDLDAEDDAFLASLDIPMNRPIPLQSLKYLTDYTRLITMEKNDIKPNKDSILDALMRAFLLSLSCAIHEKKDERFAHQHYQTMLTLREMIKNSPQKAWTINEMAQQSNMSISCLQHLYKKLFGITCMQDVILERMRKARHFLRSTKVSIVHLSELCGYENETHFMRQFKKHQGLTPSQYRQQHKKF